MQYHDSEICSHLLCNQAILKATLILFAYTCVGLFLTMEDDRTPPVQEVLLWPLVLAIRWWRNN